MKRALGLSCFYLLLSACGVHHNPKGYPYVYIQKRDREVKEWKLVWEENFHSPKLDDRKWSRIPAGGADWNRHMSTDDACFGWENGELILKGIKNTDKNKDPRPFLTGGIWTKGKFACQYGRIEIRAKLGSAKGAWPAMWMLAELDKYGKYPKNGEIDIMEHLNFDKIIYQTTHSYYTLDLGQKEHPKHFGTASVKTEEYNIYGISWYPDRIVFQVNGIDTFTYPRVTGVDSSQWPYDQPFYLLIDQQLGGSWVGEVYQDQLPVEMRVDWIKVYQ